MTGRPVTRQAVTGPASLRQPPAGVRQGQSRRLPSPRHLAKMPSVVGEDLSLVLEDGFLIPDDPQLVGENRPESILIAEDLLLIGDDQLVT